MNATDAGRADALRQHVIDPEICIRCNTCEEACPIDAVTHDSRNYVVKPDVCNGCGACVPPCPTGAIDNWRNVLRVDAYSVEAQLGWDELPVEQALPASEAGAGIAPAPIVEATSAAPAAAPSTPVTPTPVRGATVPPWSAAHPYTNLYRPGAPVTATVMGNFRVTGEHSGSDTRHIVLDFGTLPFPVLEGQSIGIIPPGTDTQGRPHHARQYSIASPRDGERPGYNNLSLTVKRVTADHDGQPVRGVCSNYLCDVKKGDTVQVIGPFGASFLMPNHPGTHLVMICTGTGSAPMRAMTEYRRRHRERFGEGRLTLFFGARTADELPYFGPLTKLPKDFIDIHLAFSRTPGEPKRYVQDLMRESSASLAPMLSDPNTFIYVCGLKSMEEGVLAALQDIANGAGLAWESLTDAWAREGRLHLETY